MTTSARIRRGTSILTSCAFLFAGVLTMPANARDGNHSHLPDARDLLDKHIAATGGERAYLALKSRKKTGKLDVKMAGHDFVANTVQQALAPNKTHTTIDGSFFFQVSVCDGEQAWGWRPAQSHGDKDVNLDSGQTEFVTGAAKKRAIDNSHFYAAVNWRDRFVDVKTIGMVDVDGAPAYEVQCRSPRRAKTPTPSSTTSPPAVW
ncbi:MAG: hypothetical protein ACI8QZ_002068 [Chlamydiales bacterium]|jgi:hypothetical protein